MTIRAHPFALLCLFPLVGAACESAPDQGASPAVAEAQSPSPPTNLVERGEYMVRVGGCNDCHTAGYLETGGDVPMNQWLTGTSLGHRGPWGTTYATNLRLKVKEMSEDQWFQHYSQNELRPPMPWMSLHMMKEQDLRAVYRFIRSLGPAGEPVPAYLPPGETPSTPYVDYTVQMPQS